MTKFPQKSQYFFTRKNLEYAHGELKIFKLPKKSKTLKITLKGFKLANHCSVVHVQVLFVRKTKAFPIGCLVPHVISFPLNFSNTKGLFRYILLLLRKVIFFHHFKSRAVGILRMYQRLQGELKCFIKLNSIKDPFYRTLISLG